MRRVKLGIVGVDSGQLIIADPCYIDSEWEKNDEFKDIRRYKDSILNREFEYGKDFAHFEVVIPECEGKTPNILIQEGRWEEVEVPEKIAKKGKFSYAGCCETTIGHPNHGGQLDYKLGHPGAGVVFSSGFGDGTYEVWAIIDDYAEWGERIKEVRIKLIDEDEVDKISKL